jgi:hypothetical protein
VRANTHHRSAVAGNTSGAAAASGIRSSAKNRKFTSSTLADSAIARQGVVEGEQMIGRIRDAMSFVERNYGGERLRLRISQHLSCPQNHA